MMESAVTLEKQIRGAGNWIKQTQEGWVNYSDGNVQEDQCSRHVVGTFMGQFFVGDKLRLSAYAASRNETTTDLKLLAYNGGTCYLRGHMIHAI